MLGGSAVGFASMSVRHTYFLAESLADTGKAALAGIAALALLRRNLLSQVFARGVGWLILLPSAATVIESLLEGRWPHGGELWFAASAAGALLLAKPELDTPEARREFDPVAYRRVFLAGAVASVTGSIVAASYAAGTWMFGVRASAFGLAALAASLVASAVGVVRMRGWGVLLGAVTALGALVAALTARDEFTAAALALAALPGMLLVAPLVAARVRPPEPATAPARVPARADVEWDEAPPVRARIADALEAEAIDASVTERASSHAE
jgi:hypothetical protein